MQFVKPGSLLLALFILLSPIAQADDLQKTIDRVLTTYGGAKLWKETHSVKYSGATFSQMLHQLGQTTRSYQYPDKSLIDIRYDTGESESRMLNGDKVWNHGEPGKGPFVLATRLQSYRQILPKQLLEHRNSAKDLGTRKDENSKIHHGIELPLEESLKIILDIDGESGRILSIWSVMAMGGQTIQFATLYDDFRTVDGRLVAFKEEHYAMGNYTGHTEIEKVEFNINFPDGTFEPTEKK